MAPERIDPTGKLCYPTLICNMKHKRKNKENTTNEHFPIEIGNPGQYDIRSDVWSLGISMVEMATGKFPYNTWLTPFEQLKQVRLP